MSQQTKWNVVSSKRNPKPSHFQMVKPKESSVYKEYTDDYTMLVRTTEEVIVRYELRAGVILYDPAVEKILLVLSRWIDRPECSRWGIPKGLVEPGENIYECAERELYEETGIRVPIDASVPYLHIKNTYYFIKSADSRRMIPQFGAMCPNYQEIESCRWVSKNMIPTYCINKETLFLVQKRWKFMIKLLRDKETKPKLEIDTDVDTDLETESIRSIKIHRDEDTDSFRSIGLSDTNSNSETESIRLESNV